MESGVEECKTEKTPSLTASQSQNFAKRLGISDHVNVVPAVDRVGNPRFNGPMPGTKDARTRTKGVMKKIRALKRFQAEARNGLS